MLISAFTALTVLFLIHLLIHYILKDLSFWFYKSCFDFFDSDKKYNFLSHKILCSYKAPQSLSSENEKQFLLFSKNLGLIHLFVASGAHLYVLKNGFEFLLQKIKSKKFFIEIILIIFVLCSNLSCPITRSWMQIQVNNLSKKYSLAFSPINQSIIASIGFLLIFPSHILSSSFYLSSCASLCLSLFRKNNFHINLSIYIALFPLIISYGTPDFMSIFVNFFLAPIIAISLIWNTVFYSFFSFYEPVGDQIYLALKKSYEILNIYTADQKQYFFNSSIKYLQSLYIVLFFIFAHFIQYLKTYKLLREIKKNAL